MSQAGKRIKCTSLRCGTSFLLPGTVVGPVRRPVPASSKPKRPALKTIAVSLICLLAIGSIVLGAVLIINKKKAKPTNPPVKIVQTEGNGTGPGPKPPDPGGEGQVDQKTLANMVGMVVLGAKLTSPGGETRELPSLTVKMSIAEIAAAKLPKEEFIAMCNVEHPIKDPKTKKVVAFNFGVGGSGSCFLITPDGYAITNQHVTQAIYYAQNHTEVVNRLKNKTWLAKSSFSSWTPTPQIWVFFEGVAHEATIVFQHDKIDFSILKIDGISGAPFFKLSAKRKPDDLVLNTKVVTLGYPGSSRGPGLRSKEEQELLDNKKKKTIKDWFPESDFKLVLKGGVVAVTKDRLDEGFLIEHDATINGGNSGGPLVSEAGLDKPTENAVVYGINTWTVTAGDNSYLSIMMETVRKNVESRVPSAVWVDK